MGGGGIDPNVVMLDQFVRVFLAEVLKASIWIGLGVIAYRVFRAK